ncbi:MBL fold metallo-hydrolase [Thermoleophilum album]|uniref:MBL fold metallo-hydrolase n=1 Tax=Thermoleophilum album TaxID=29539 RepID=UPI0019C9BE0E|nr:MBL fold metallo-hydrolase [Thermoleophilum album]WDT93060.1 MBL fold metallo-hydrolase [Thermoleophilum album]
MLLEPVEWLGHAGFRLRLGRAFIYIDPYRVARPAPQADLILVTHGHYDHFSPRDIEELAKADTWLIGPAAVVERVRGRVCSLAPGEALLDEPVRGLEVRAIAAYNTSKRDPAGRLYHPREAGWLGFELRWRGWRLYHAGDTDVIPEMDAVTGCDVALLPVSGRYVMTAEEAAEAARRIQPRVAVPMHWGGEVGTRDDAERFRKCAPVAVELLEPVGSASA